MSLDTETRATGAAELRRGSWLGKTVGGNGQRPEISERR